MKIKIEILKNILIYILVLIAAFLAMILINQNYILKDLDKIAGTRNIIVEQNLRVIDDNGDNISSKYIEEYDSMTKKKEEVKKFELKIYFVIVCSGFLIIIFDTYNKFQQISDVIDENIEKFNQMQLNSKVYKYEELEEIKNKVNDLIIKIDKKQQANDRMYENIIHDFATPLHILSGNLELHKKGIDLDYKVIDKQIKRLLYLNKINLLKHEYENKMISGREIKSYINLLATTYPQFKFEYGINEDVKFKTKVENFYRIIDNIITNAIKHATPQIIEINLFEQNSGIIFEINNDGKKISQLEKNLIFKRNYSSTSSGIGLNIVNQILEDLNYQLEIKSDNKITKFIIKIPQKGCIK